ncbi:MAG: class I mannose-6-phosphate isomerase [Phycisphaerales bacterium]|nr:class I mannose-6-phosphate isomerase [Phycisphaerales bacterium]
MTSAHPLPPLRFVPMLKHRAWGGDRLADLDKTMPPDTLIGESWELSDLPDSIPEGQSIVADGPLQGQRLHQLLEDNPDALLGQVATTADGRFPLLIKYLDAAENLSVQVHPSPEYAAEHEEAKVKSEWWFIISAEPGACVYRGIRPEVTPAAFKQSIEQGTTLEFLEKIPVHEGMCIRLPSGICHAMGAGILAAEVQTTSDTTFRVWDWNRNDPNRPLHIEQAMGSMRFGAAQDQGGRPILDAGEIPPVVVGGIGSQRACTAPEFTIDLQAIGEGEHAIETDDRPVILICLEGNGTIRSAAGEARLRKGDVVLVPARGSACRLECLEPQKVLRVDIPAQAGTLLA